MPRCRILSLFSYFKFRFIGVLSPFSAGEGYSININLFSVSNGLYPQFSPSGTRGGDIRTRMSGEGWGERDGSAAQFHNTSTASRHPHPTRPPYPQRRPRRHITRAPHEYHCATRNITSPKATYHCNACVASGWGSRDGFTAPNYNRQLNPLLNQSITTHNPNKPLFCRLRHLAKR